MPNRLTFAAVAAATTFLLTASAYAISDGGSTSALKQNTVFLTKKFTLTNGGVVNAAVECPSGYRIFSGGYASNGQFAQITVAAPARAGNNYILSAWMPPVNINVPVLRETATITVAAWCAKTGQPIVLGSN